MSSICASHVHMNERTFRVRGDEVLFLWLPVELSDSDHSCASFFWWLFRLFPMVTPCPTTTATLKGALKRATWPECRSMRSSPELNFLQKTPLKTQISLLPMPPHSADTNTQGEPHKTNPQTLSMASESTRPQKYIFMFPNILWSLFCMLYSNHAHLHFTHCCEHKIPPSHVNSWIIHANINTGLSDNAPVCFDFHEIKWMRHQSATMMRHGSIIHTSCIPST